MKKKLIKGNIKKENITEKTTDKIVEEITVALATLERKQQEHDLGELKKQAKDFKPQTGPKPIHEFLIKFRSANLKVRNCRSSAIFELSMGNVDLQTLRQVHRVLYGGFE